MVGGKTSGSAEMGPEGAQGTKPRRTAPTDPPHRSLRWALSLTEATAGRVGGGKKGQNEPQGRGGTVH